MNIQATFIDDLSSRIDESLDRDSVRLALIEFAEIEKRFSFGDWSPTECSAGRFCEAIVRPVELLDRGISTSNTPSKVAEVLLNKDVPHNLNSVDRKNLAKVIGAVYEIRSSRNSVHLAPGYTADYVDSMFTLSSCKWLICELFRLASGIPNEETAKNISSLLMLREPVFFVAGSRAVLMKTGLSASQEVLAHLFHVQGNRASKSYLRNQLQNYHSVNSVDLALRRLIERRHVATDEAGDYWLTYLGRSEALAILS